MKKEIVTGDTVQNKRQIRCITREMVQERQRNGCYTDLAKLNALKDEYFGSIRAMAEALCMGERTLDRRMSGELEFTFEEILRVAYVFSLTEEETHEIFFAGYLAA